MEITNILENNNWKVLGACEISCLKVWETTTDKEDVKRKEEINNEIKSNLKAFLRPNTPLESAQEANRALLKRIEALEAVNNKGTKGDYRERLEHKAAELEMKFRADISDSKLLEKINEIDKDFK